MNKRNKAPSVVSSLVGAGGGSVASRNSIASRSSVASRKSNASNRRSIPSRSARRAAATNNTVKRRRQDNISSSASAASDSSSKARYRSRQNMNKFETASHGTMDTETRSTTSNFSSFSSNYNNSNLVSPLGSGNEIIMFDRRSSTSNEISLKQGILNLMTNERISDITLIGTNGERILGNRGMLAARSPKFETMFFPEDEDEEEDDDDMIMSENELNLNYSGKVLRAVVEYIYSNRVSILEPLLQAKPQHQRKRGSSNSTGVTSADMEIYEDDFSSTILALIDAASYFGLDELCRMSLDYATKFIREHPSQSISWLAKINNSSSQDEEMSVMVHHIHELVMKQIRHNPKLLLGENDDTNHAMTLLSKNHMELILKDQNLHASEYTMFCILTKWANVPFRTESSAAIVTKKKKVDKVETNSIKSISPAPSEEEDEEGGGGFVGWGNSKSSMVSDDENDFNIEHDDPSDPSVEEEEEDDREMVDESSLVISDEDNMFKRREKRLRDAKELSKHIALHLIDPEDLNDFVAKSGIISEKQLLEAYREQCESLSRKCGVSFKSKYRAGQEGYGWKNSKHGDLHLSDGKMGWKTDIVSCPPMTMGNIYQWGIYIEEFVSSGDGLHVGVAATTNQHKLQYDKFLGFQEGGWTLCNKGYTYESNESVLRRDTQRCFGRGATLIFTLDLTTKGTLSVAINGQAALQICDNMIHKNTQLMTKSTNRSTIGTLQGPKSQQRIPKGKRNKIGFLPAVSTRVYGGKGIARLRFLGFD